MMNIGGLPLGVLGCLSILLVPPSALFAWQPTTQATSQQDQFFESKVRPLLIEHCYNCHGVEKQKGELRLDSRKAILAGGDSGPTIVPGKPEESLLIQAIQYKGLEMPPKGKLSQDKIQVLTTWVKLGAPWPGPDKSSPSPPGPNKLETGRGKVHEFTITKADRAYWAFQPVVRPPVPNLKANPNKKHPIDAFVESRLELRGLIPNGPATTRELIRRVYFDLVGLPPTFGEMEQWASRMNAQPKGEGRKSPDTNPINEGAYRELIDHLMNRPAYGEHWGRHWLDVVRFAQSNGYERDGYKPFAWRYRDYVISSFQKDKPYNRFIEEQIAGDELPDANPETRTATGYFRLGVWDDEPDDKRQAEFEELDDILVTTGASFLGLTLGCARCHDHKFDPIPQADYYRLLAFVRNIKPYANPEQTLGNASFVPISENAKVREAVEKLRTRKAKREAEIASTNNEVERKKLEAIQIDDSLPDLEWALGVRDRLEIQPTNILIRGNASTPGQEVSPGFPLVLSPAKGKHPEVTATPPRTPLGDLFPTTGRRFQLAQWLSNKENPLTARVMVNRIWHYHFGRGIVASTGDFGKAGTPPTHPELLDWLASEFMEKGWSIKEMHRTILMSETYRRSSQISTATAVSQTALTLDPGNFLLWRQNLRRLDAEAIRDSLLSASGELDSRVGGPEMFPKLSGEVLAGQSKPGLDWEISKTQDRLRRSIYGIVKRSVRDPLMDSFDYANTTSPLTERPVTTVAPQALILLNNRFTAERAAALVQKIGKHNTQPNEQIREFFRAILQRDPTGKEVAIGIDYLNRTESGYLPIARRMTFRPDVPVSLFSGFRQKLRGEDCLLGPSNGWLYFRGSWGGGYESIDVVDPKFGPFAFWQGAEFAKGEIRGRIHLEAATQMATLIAQGRPEGDKWSGVALTLDRVKAQIQIRESVNGHEHATVAPLEIPQSDWIPFRFAVDDSIARAWVGENQTGKPVIERTLLKTRQRQGRIGVATWGGPISLDPFEVECDQGKWDVARSNVPTPFQGNPKGWSSFGGDWSILPGGSLSVRPEMGPKLIWDSEPLHNGEVRIEMKFSKRNAAIGGLILRVSEPKIGADNWFGHEVSLDFGTRTVFLGDHRNNWKLLQSQAVNIAPETWHKLRVVMAEKRLRVFVDGASKPQIDAEVDPPLSGSLVGLRTWGSEIEYRNMEVIQDGKTVKPNWAPPSGTVTTPPVSDFAWARHRSLEAYCRSLFNLNEFIYVD